MAEDITNGSHVEFKEKGFCIEICTGSNPMDYWQSLYRTLIWYAGHENPDLPPSQIDRANLTMLLEAMLPKWEDMLKMKP